MYPKFSVVIPEPDLVKLPLAYPIGQRDQAFATFVNTWIELKQKDGTLDRSTSTGFSARTPAPRRRAGLSCATCCTGPSEAPDGVHETGFLNGDT